MTEEQNPLGADQPNNDGTSSNQWDKEKAEIIGHAIDKTLYRNHPFVGSLAGQPAEEVFRGNHESSFEKLYSLAPEKFADMPTSEFITLERKFSRIESRIEEAKSALT